MAQYGPLHLIPVPLAEGGRWLGSELEELVGTIKHWVVETPKTARAQLRAINPQIDLPSLELSSWSKHGSNEALTLLQPCLSGNPMGLISDAGAPGMADPGAEVVAKAHQFLTFTTPPDLQNATAYGLRQGDDYFDGYAERVRRVTLQDVAAAAQLLQPAETVWVVVGDRAKVEAGLKALGLGEPRLLDADGNPLAATAIR